MAPKQSSLSQKPPASAPSSSSSEEEGGSDFIEDKEDDGQYELNQKKLQAQESDEEEEEDAEEEEEEDDDDDEEVPQPLQEETPHQKTSVNPVSSEQQSSSECESVEGSDSEAGSDKSIRSPSASDFTIKPILSKSDDNSPKSQKQNLKAPILALTAGSKRPSGSEKNGRDDKKKKSKVEDHEGVSEVKSSGINRLFSEDDEIAVLKGMLEYQSKNGTDPYADMAAFHEFIGNSLHVNVSKNQLTDKIRRLKKKYHTNAGKGNKLEDPVFSKPHEQKAFVLSKKIWGGGTLNNGADESVKSASGKAAGKNHKLQNNSKPTMPQPERETVIEKEDTTVGEKTAQEDFWSLYPYLNESLEVRRSSYLSMSESGIAFIKENMNLIGSEDTKKFDNRWKNLLAKEVKLSLQRMELIREQTRVVLDAFNSSKS